MISLDEARKARELASKLGGAFAWSDTPQGHSYWWKVQDNLSDLASAAGAGHDAATAVRLEVGKKYKTKNGDEVTITSKDSTSHPFNSNKGRFYTENGKCWQGEEHNIVEEVKSSIQLKVGGKYKTKEGKVVEIARTTGNTSYPFITKCGYSYTDDGFYYKSKSYHEYNIVEVVDEPSELKMQVELGGKKYKLVEVA